MPRRLKKLTLALFSLAVVYLVPAMPTKADTVFVYTGAGNGTFSGGATGTFTGGVNVTSPNGTQQFREIPQGNSTATLTVNGLAANSMTTLTFNLYVIQTIDGNGESGAGADLFNLSANGGTLLNATFSNTTATQSYPSNIPPGASNAPGTGRSNQNSLGYGIPPGVNPAGVTFNDTTYSLSFTAMANAAGSITFTFTGLQTEAAGNESFGIDNITVDATVAGQPPSAVPEPTTMLLLGTGLAGVAVKARKRRKAARNDEG